MAKTYKFRRAGQGQERPGRAGQGQAGPSAPGRARQGQERPGRAGQGQQRRALLGRQSRSYQVETEKNNENIHDTSKFLLVRSYNVAS